MQKIKVMTIFGTRPEAIKMAPLVKELERRKSEFESIVCVTAQHRQMLDQVLDIFNITPRYDLDIMKAGQTLCDITCRSVTGLDGAIKEAKPDIVLVHGDTSTTLAGALAAFYNKAEVGHVEAGLRTYDRYSPYPEEMNRRLTSQLATIHFAPTVQNRDNLLKENIKKDVFITGNTVIDALSTTVKTDYNFKNEQLSKVDFSKPTILLTAHRRENLGKPMENIMEAVKDVVTSYENLQVVYPVHLNPAVREIVFRVLGDVSRVHLIDPVDVEDMHNLMNRCYFVMTDSGGLQEEAPSLGKPVLVLRCETERPEAVKYGTVKIAGVEKDNITALAKELIEDKSAYDKMARAANPYGDGEASRRICDSLLYRFGKTNKGPDEFLV